MIVCGCFCKLCRQHTYLKIWRLVFIPFPQTLSVSFAVWNGAIYQAESSGLDGGAREFSQSELNNICSEHPQGN